MSAQPHNVIEYQPQGEIIPQTPMAMLSLAVAKNMSPETIKGFMDLQERWERNQAERAYNEAFASFKAEAVTVIRNKTVTDGPLKGKSYAELFAIVDAVTPALSRHGLSAAWKVTKDDRDWIEVTCFLRHAKGHSESVSFGGPPDAGGAKNAIQARASTKTYLERYTLLAVTGLSAKDQDSDGNTSKGLSDAEVEKWKKAIEAETTKEKAKAVWQESLKACEVADDVKAAEILKAALKAHGDFIDKAAKQK